MAKFFVLLDACRLDTQRHHAPLKKLCHAFYDHVQKAAYYAVVSRTAQGFQFWNLAHARDIFRLELVKHWPADEDWGVPPMPHDVYFTRDANLYVDFDEYSDSWMAPDNRHARFWFGKDDHPVADRLAEARVLHADLLAIEHADLHRPEALKIFNAIFATHYINRQVSNQELKDLQQRVINCIENDLGIPRATTECSAMMMWPLYDFLTEPAPRAFDLLN